MIFVHIPEETVKITKAIFSCTFESEISLKKIGAFLQWEKFSMLSYPNPITATYFNTLESESLCHLHHLEGEENWLRYSWGIFLFLGPPNSLISSYFKHFPCQKPNPHLHKGNTPALIHEEKHWGPGILPG